MIRINKPLTKQISLIFALFVTFSLFLGCGDEGNILEPPEAEWETKRIVLLAPNFEKDTDDLKVEFKYAEGSPEEPEFTVIRNDDNELEVSDEGNENNYWVGITANRDLKEVKVIYIVKCVEECQCVDPDVNPDLPPNENCFDELLDLCEDNQVVISKFEGNPGIPGYDDEGNPEYPELPANETIEITFTVTLNQVPPSGTQCIRNKVCVEYKARGIP